MLSVLPLISWCSQYLLSKKNGLMSSFKEHWTCYSADWIFVIINFLFIYSVQISNKLWLIFLFSFVINLITHYFWGCKNRIEQLNGHFFHSKTSKLNKSGIIHLFFSAIEMTIVISILLLTPVFPIIFLELLFVFIFAGLIIFGCYKTHSKINNFVFIFNFCSAENGNARSISAEDVPKTTDN